MFDDGVIYDSNSFGISEAQNSTHVRIKDETPKLKTSSNISGVETNIKKFMKKPTVNKKEVRQPTSDDVISTNNECLGTCTYDFKSNSALKVNLYGGEFVVNDIKTYYSSVNIDGVPIPQIPINMYISSSYIKNYESVYTDSHTHEVDDLPYNDGSGFQIKFVNPIMRIAEEGGFDEKDNYSMTAFKVNSSSAGISYTKLKFPPKQFTIKNDILVDNKATDEILFDNHFDLQADNPDGPVLNPEFLSYYLTILRDREIDDNEICNRVQDYEIENIFLDDEILCPDIMDDEIVNIYGSSVEEGDLEDCD